MTELSDLFELVTPTEIRSYVDNVHAAYLSFNTDVSKSKALSAADKQAWNLLYGNEAKFYQSVGWFATLSLGTMRTAEEFARLLSDWRTRFRIQSGFDPSGVAVQVPSGPAQVAIRNLAIVVGCGAAIYAMTLAAPFLRGLGARYESKR